MILMLSSNFSSSSTNTTYKKQLSNCNFCVFKYTNSTVKIIPEFKLIE